MAKAILRKSYNQCFYRQTMSLFSIIKLCSLFIHLKADLFLFKLDLPFPNPKMYK